LVPEEDVPIRSVSMAVDGSLLVAGNNKGNLYTWKTRTSGDMTDLEALAKIPAHPKYMTKCLLSPDTRLLATCAADHSVKIWYFLKNDELGILPITNLLWKNNCMDIRGGIIYRVNNTYRVWDCAFSADSAYLVTGSSDHSARLWDLSNGETIRHYNGHQKAVTCIAIHDVKIE
jgi:G protein beta subunit-like protein